MTSRERRMLHLILSESGLPTASSGEGPGRFVVLYPAGADTSEPMGSEAPPARRHDANRIRENFRHR
jgi:spoIIIJ-associated protein